MGQHKADAIVVLGAAVWQGGVPSPTLSRRVRHAVRLFKEGAAEYLLLTGGVGKHPPSEARVMQCLAVEQGIAESQVILEETATNTLESAEHCARIVKQKEWSEVVIVTDAYHLLRSLLAFRSCGVRAQGSAPGEGREGTGLWRWYYLYLGEIAALPWYLARLMIRKLRRPGSL